MELAKYSVFFEVLGNFSVVDAVQNLWMYKLQVEMMVDQSPILHLKEIRSTSHRKSRKSPRLDFFFLSIFFKDQKNSNSCYSSQSCPTWIIHHPLKSHRSPTHRSIWSLQKTNTAPFLEQEKHVKNKPLSKENTQNEWNACGNPAQQ